jgi:hypothetical protein
VVVLVTFCSIFYSFGSRFNNFFPTLVLFPIDLILAILSSLKLLDEDPSLSFFVQLFFNVPLEPINSINCFSSVTTDFPLKGLIDIESS